MTNRMLGRALVVALVVTVALAGAEAFAATCTSSKTLSTQTCCSWRTTSSGVRYCALWCTGSQICDNLITGLGGNVLKDCSGDTCPTTECAAYGTMDIGVSGSTCNQDPLVLDPNCGMKGLLVCTNPNEKFNAQGTPYTLGGYEQTISNSLICDKNGKCTNSLTLDASLSSELCVNHNWHFKTFTASEFKAKACFCPGGFDSRGKCCETSERVGTGPDAVCSADYGDGTPICFLQLCTVDLATYDYFTNRFLPYTCENTTTCGGTSPEPCPEPKPVLPQK
jgi:hypothetical protein